MGELIATDGPGRTSPLPQTPFPAVSLICKEVPERAAAILMDQSAMYDVRTRAFGGLAATRLQPENFQKIRAGWPFLEPRLIQLERLEF